MRTRERRVKGVELDAAIPARTDVTVYVAATGTVCIRQHRTDDAADLGDMVILAPTPRTGPAPALCEMADALGTAG